MIALHLAPPGRDRERNRGLDRPRVAGTVVGVLLGLWLVTMLFALQIVPGA